MATRHPADQPVVTLHGVEVFAKGVHNGDSYTDADLDGMIRAAGECGFTAPVKLGHMSDGDTDRLLKAEALPSFGWVRKLRRQGTRLIADLVDVPKRLGELIRRGAYKRISAEIYWNYKNAQGTWPRVLKAVSLLGGEIPAVTSLKEIEALYSYTERGQVVKRYWGEVIPLDTDIDALLDGELDGEDEDAGDANDGGGAACAEDQGETEMDRFEQTDAVQTDAIDAEVMRRVHAYQQEDPTLSFEDGYRQLPHRDPDLWRRYGEKTYATLRTVAVSPAEHRAAADWHQAGLEILREADRYQEASPELSREEAIHAVLRDNAELTRRYARGSTPPGP